MKVTATIAEEEVFDEYFWDLEGNNLRILKDFEYKHKRSAIAAAKRFANKHNITIIKWEEEKI